MTKRRKARHERRKAKPTREHVVYRNAYHVNLGQSLAALNGWPTSEDGAGLRGRWADAIRRPLGQLAPAELVLLLTQGVDAQSLHYLWPVIFEHLRADICAGQGSSLLELMVGQTSFWTHHPHALAQLVALIDTRTEQLEAALDPGLADVAQDFAARHRGE